MPAQLGNRLACLQSTGLPVYRAKRGTERSLHVVYNITLGGWTFVILSDTGLVGGASDNCDVDFIYGCFTVKTRVLLWGVTLTLQTATKWHNTHFQILDEVFQDGTKDLTNIEFKQDEIPTFEFTVLNNFSEHYWSYYRPTKPIG